MSKLTVYAAEWCAACSVEVPKVVELANRLSLQVEVVDIGRCPVSHKETCDSLEAVPTLMLDGREVTREQLEARLPRKP